MATDWQGKLRKESEGWVRRGLISEHQQKAILALYPDETVSSGDRTVMILSILGSLLVGAGVILYFAANWPRIHPAVKVIALLAGMLGSYWAGYYFQYRRGDSPRLGQALIFLGSLLYGAGIWLIAQIFHLDTDFPTGFLAWGAAILPLAWVTGSRPILYLAVGTLIIWTGGAQSTLGQHNYLFPVLMLATVVPLARRTESRLAEAAVLLGLFLWYTLNVRQDLFTAGFGMLILTLGRLVLLYGAALFLGGLARIGDGRTYMGTGGFLALLGAYLLTIPLPAWMGYHDRFLPSLFEGGPFAVAGILTMLAAVLLFVFLYIRRSATVRYWLLAAALVPVAAVLTAEWLPEVPRLILFNLLLFGGAVGLVTLGIRTRMELLVNLGLIGFALQMITRYFDLFFSAMNRSFFFIFGGVLLLVGGWILERNRRRWVGDWGGVDDES